MGTYGKHNENTGVPWEPMENTMKTCVFFFSQETIENIMKTHTAFSVGNYGKLNENTGFPWEPKENTRKT